MKNYKLRQKRIWDLGLKFRAVKCKLVTIGIACGVTRRHAFKSAGLPLYYRFR